MRYQDILQIARAVVRAGGGRSEVQRRAKCSLWTARRAVLEARAELATSSCPTCKLKHMRRARGPLSYEEMAESFGDVNSFIDNVRQQGYLVTKIGDTYFLDNSAAIEPASNAPIQLQYGNEVSFGVVSDTHLGSRFCRLDILRAAYDTFAEHGIKVVLHAGNLVDGDSKVNKHDVLIHGIAEQAMYVLEHYPMREGIVTYFIDGDDHEGWWRQSEGIEFGHYLQNEACAAGRTDLKYMGYLENDIILPAPRGKTVIRVIHPGGGSAYAISYSSQKIVESYVGGEKPDILIIGHYHKLDYCIARGVHCVQVPSTQDQTIFMRKKRLQSQLGFGIIRFIRSDDGAVIGFTPTFYPFFDRAYYEKRADITSRLTNGQQ